MKQINKIFLLTILFIIIFGTGSALAGDYYSLDYYTDPTSISSLGGDVTLTVTINHDMNSAFVMTDAAIYKGDKIVIDIGNIYAGQEITKSGWLSVDSEEILGVDLTLRYSESGVTLKKEDFTVTFNTIDNIQPVVEFTRTLSKTSGSSGDTVIAQYTVKNSGQVHIQDLVISDGAVGDIKTLSILKTGQKTVVDKEITIGDGFTSSPKITYNVGSQGYTDTLDDIEVVSGTPELGMELMANKSTATIGETIDIAIKVTNTGTTGLDTVTISEETIGELFAIDGLAADESITKSYELIIEEGVDYTFVAVGDNGGELEWMAQQMLDVIVDIDAPPLEIDFSANASTIVLDSPGIVTFDLKIENNTGKTLVNVVITDNMGNEIKTIDRLLPGPTKFQYRPNVEQSSSYFFTLSITNAAGEAQTVSTTPVDITVGNTTVATTSAPNVTSTPAGNNQNGANNNGILSGNRGLLLIGLGLVALLLLVVLVQVAVRSRRGY